MRDRFRNFMYGRYGGDDFNRFLSFMVLVLIIISIIIGRFPVPRLIFYALGLATLIISFYRTFSKDIYRRQQENERYLKLTSGIRRFFTDPKYREERKYYHIYACPSCRQKIRIPRGKGRIEVCCPRCKYRFIRKS